MRLFLFAVLVGLLVGLLGCGDDAASLPGADTSDSSESPKRSQPMANVGTAKKASLENLANPARLELFLPAALPGLPLRETRARASRGRTATANAHYRVKAGESKPKIRISLTDLGSFVGAPVVIVKRTDVDNERETVRAFERAGRRVEELLDKRTGEFRITVRCRSRLKVDVAGRGVSADQVRAALALIDLDRLESDAAAGNLAIGKGE